MENLPKTIKSRLGADYSLDHTGGLGGRMNQNDNENNLLLVLILLSWANFPFLDFISLEMFVLDKNRLRQKSRLRHKQIVSTGQFFVFNGYLGFAG